MKTHVHRRRSLSMICMKTAISIATAWFLSACASAVGEGKEEIAAPPAVEAAPPPVTEIRKEEPAPPVLMRRPRPGDKLGYSKEESIRRLDPEVRRLLDVLLRMYREPGLFTDRREAIAALGVDKYERTWNTVSQRSVGEPMHYVDRFARQGIFARRAWQGRYVYDGWRGPQGDQWYARLDVDVDIEQECHSSRAVEGYLDLFLQSGLEGKPHPVPATHWDRHGQAGWPYALPLGQLTPGLGMTFMNGCLASIGVYGAFESKEVSDEKVRR